MNEPACFRSEGFQIYSAKGEVLNTISLFDNILSFSLNRQGNIIYLGSREINKSKESFMKCVTREGTIIFQTKYPNSERVNAVLPDDEGNVLACDISFSYSAVSVVKEDGTIKCLFTAADTEWHKLTTMCYIEDLTRVVISYEIYETSLRRV